MKEISYIPKPCQESKDEHGAVTLALFSGSVKMRLPNFDERYDIIEKAGLKVSQTGEIDTSGNAIQIIRNIVKVSKEFYVSVDIKKLSDGTEYKSFEDLSMDSDCDAIITDIARALRDGFKPSKN